jgi:membrane associated rhomboid family serine protease
MIPLRDVIPSRTTPGVTVSLIAVNVAVYLFQLMLTDRGQDAFIVGFGLIPAYFSFVSVVTSMFVHGGLAHLAGNMLFLWIFGDNVEERLGRTRFIIFYLLAGVVGALAQIFSSPASKVPMIGASGAIAGVLGGYLMLYPRAKVVTFVGIPWLWHLLDIPAWVFLGVWFLGQFWFSRTSGVAWMAHVGGFLAGLGAVRLLAGTGPSSPTTTTTDVEYLPPRGR